MERKVTVPIYVGAFLVSLLIFIIGIYVGSLVDQNNMNSLQGDVSSISESVASVQLLLLSEGNSSSFCPVYSSELQSIDQQVETVGYKLSYLEDEKQVYDNDLKKRYFLLEAESLLLSKKIQGLCGSQSVLLINFYSNSNCSSCKDQGTEVLRARDQLEPGTDVKLFSFDGDIGSPVAAALMSEYNVTSYPTIVINGKAYPGYRTSDQLKTLIAESR
jgi:hypothetical protein